MTRRRFLKLAAAGLGAMALPRRWRRSYASTHQVGVGSDSNAYAATVRALAASSEWTPGLVGGRTVLIKPNLVRSNLPESGVVTDPQVVRAIVDSALAGGAERIKIVEGYPSGSHFSACGYGFLQDYGGTGQVSLLDLAGEADQLLAIDGGLA